jgi:hypothetical protein
LISASIAHFARGDPRLSVFFVVDPPFFLGLLAVSYFYFEKSRRPRRTSASEPTPEAGPAAETVTG